MTEIYSSYAKRQRQSAYQTEIIERLIDKREGAMSDLFRKSALEKLSSPEQLDRAVVITPPAFWIALFGGFFIILGAVIWGIFGRLPVHVEANGIYISGDKTGGVYSEIQGIVTDVAVTGGEQVEKGQVIAYVGGGDLVQEVKTLSERMEDVRKVTLGSKDDNVTSDTKALVDVKSELLSLTTVYEQSELSWKEKQEQLNAKQKEVDSLKSRMDSLKETYYASLEEDIGALEQMEYSEAQAELSTKQQYCESAQSQVQQASLEMDKTQSAFDEVQSMDQQVQSAFAEAQGVYQQYQDSYAKWQQQMEQLQQTELTAEQMEQISSEQSALEEKISQASAVYASAKEKQIASQQAVAEAQIALQTAQEAYRMAQSALEGYQQERSDAQNRFDAAKANYQNVLSQQGDISRSKSAASNEYSQAVSEYSAQRSLLESLKQEENALRMQTAQAEEEMNIKQEAIDSSFSSTKDSIISSLKSEIDRYTQNLKKYEILSTQDGVVKEVIADEGAIVAQGSEIIRVKSVTSTDEKEAVCYIPVKTGKKVVPGMEVMIYPSTVNKQEYGHMLGTVESVSSYVTSTTEMMKMLGDETLVQSFMNNGPVVQAVCTIKEDEDTRSGYYWSSKKGADVDLTEGTMLTANIVTEKKAPISMLIPYLKEKLTMEPPQMTRWQTYPASALQKGE